MLSILCVFPADWLPLPKGWGVQQRGEYFAVLTKKQKVVFYFNYSPTRTRTHKSIIKRERKIKNEMILWSLWSFIMSLKPQSHNCFFIWLIHKLSGVHCILLALKPQANTCFLNFCEARSVCCFLAHILVLRGWVGRGGEWSPERGINVDSIGSVSKALLPQSYFP